ncbi:MAG: peptidoglycan DD-metalloendopeptidase family protein [Actinomycetota bacterium]
MRIPAIVSSFILALAPAPAAAATWLIPPVEGVVAVRFQAPQVDWGPGHRGIDYQVPAGAPVRAAAAGTVSFAGEVAGSLAVTVDHPGGLATTYSILSEVYVAAGDRVGAGEPIGGVGGSHPGADSGLHFGVKLEGRYVDPESYLGPVDVAGAIHLVPLAWEPPASLRSHFEFVPAPVPWDPDCVANERLARATDPPNDNVAIAVAGIGSSTKGGIAADIYEHGPGWLGYPEHKVYRFSYKGSAGNGSHEPYLSTDTYGNLEEAAERLQLLVAEVGRLHPGSGVDLIAHSQGGVVARAYLELAAEEWEADRPRIEHLVTFATPHTGAPAAGLVRDLQRRSWGPLVLDGARRWAARGGPLPDPRSPAVLQLAPGSELMRKLARERFLFGVRMLALAIPNDVIVPADRALLGGASRVVPPKGINGHRAIVSSWDARGIAYRFLRDAPETCRTGWDDWGPRLGALVGLLETSLTSLPGLALRGVL